MSETPRWSVGGTVSETPPKVGAVYKVNHSRKGDFTGRVTAVNGIWADVLILKGKANAIMDYNVKEKGETVTVRDTLAHFAEVPNG